MRAGLSDLRDGLLRDELNVLVRDEHRALSLGIIDLHCIHNLLYGLGSNVLLGGLPPCLAVGVQ